MISDLILAVRRLRRAPVFTAFAVVTLALAIGIVTAVYSLLRSGMRTDVGLSETSSLVIVAKRSPMTAALYPVDLSWRDYQDLTHQADVFEATAGWTTFTNGLAMGGTSEIALGELVSGDYFSTVGLRAERGRLIEPSDDAPGAPPVVVLSASAWRRRLGRNPEAIGSSIRLAGRPFQIIGIVPESFRGLRPPPGLGSPDVWVPLSHAAALLPSWVTQERGDRNHRWLRMVGRLGAGRTHGDAEAQIRVIGERIDQVEPLPDLATGGTYLKQTRDWHASSVAEPVSFAQSGDVARAVLLLPALVLIVACTNLGNLALSRGVSRRNEFAVRLAIGASRWQLVRGQLIEYGLVAGLGALGAIAVADRLVTLVASTVRHLFGEAPQFRIDAHLDAVTLVAVGLAALLSVIVAGLIPALQLTRRQPARLVVADQAGGSSPRWRGRSNLIALQMSVSVALLLVAALCVRQLPKLQVRARTGTSLDKVALVSVPFALQSVPEATVRRTVADLLEASRALPRAVDAAAASDRRYAEILMVATEGSEFGRGFAAHTARTLSVTPSFFRTVGLPLAAGRAFDEGDGAGSPAVVMLNESQARSLFGTANAVGRRLQLRRDAASPITLVSVAGVTADVHQINGAKDYVDDVLYLPLAQRFENSQAIEILTRVADGGDPAGLAVSVRGTLRALNPDIAVTFVGRADAMDVGPGVVLRYFTVGFGALAFLALAFAVSGLYGVLDHVVARRTRELGVRAALGANPRQLMRLVLRDGSRPVVEGIVLGLGMAAGARLGMQPWFMEPVTAIDTVALVIALIPLIIASGLACYLPARRAARVDPNVALRHL